MYNREGTHPIIDTKNDNDRIIVTVNNPDV